MNDKRLGIYLNDHLALMVAETELADRSEANNQGTPLGAFLRRLSVEAKAQKSIVRDLLARINASEDPVKVGAAWVAEKIGRVKRNDSLWSYSALSRLIDLEGLAAAAQERILLWETVDAISAGDLRLQGITYAHFRDQSRQHLEELLANRRGAVVEAFLLP